MRAEGFKMLSKVRGRLYYRTCVELRFLSQAAGPRHRTRMRVGRGGRGRHCMFEGFLSYPRCIPGGV